jgi:hypothetical protein
VNCVFFAALERTAAPARIPAARRQDRRRRVSDVDI